MKTSFIIILINLVVAVVITAIALLTEGGNSSGSDTAVAFGLVCLGMGLLNLFIGLILFFTGSKDWGRGMLLSGAVLLLLSGISCGSALSGANFR